MLIVLPNAAISATVYMRPVSADPRPCNGAQAGCCTPRATRRAQICRCRAHAVVVPCAPCRAFAPCDSTSRQLKPRPEALAARPRSVGARKCCIGRAAATRATDAQKPRAASPRARDSRNEIYFFPPFFFFLRASFVFGAGAVETPPSTATPPACGSIVAACTSTTLGAAAAVAPGGLMVTCRSTARAARASAWGNSRLRRLRRLHRLHR